MTIECSGPVIVFDYGEVVSLPPSAEDRAALEGLSGTDAGAFWEAYWGERREYDRGLTAAEYWGRVALRAGADWDAARTQRLWAADVASWLRPDPRVADLLAELAGRGVRTALLSNAPADIAGALRHSPALAAMEHLFFSCDLGACKPEPGVYRHVLEALGSAPAETVFVDDRKENVLAAAEHGIDAHHYTGFAAFRAFLAERLGAEPGRHAEP
ncbi:HAD family phosphatase [Nocardiopsis sp. CNT-189]|uniref:HAD family hydrolase n=1 Tax=Nocardiopsis oceanisediminis TaxID=2816862 RepID=UPI003B2E5B31